MTIQSTLAAVKALPYMTARWSAEWREYRVTVADLDKGRQEAAAYYTDCPDDALATAKAMSRTEQEMRGDNRPR